MDELTAAQRGDIRARIDEDRARTEQRASALARDLANIISASADSVRDDEHDPEGATIAFERAQVAALLADAHARLAALTAADARLERPDAGRCDRCGRPIGADRLLVRPASTRCVGCAAIAT